MRITKNEIRKIILEISQITRDPECKECGLLVLSVNEDEICSECERDGENKSTKLELLPAPLSPEQGYNGKTVRSHPASVDGRPNQKGWRS